MLLLAFWEYFGGHWHGSRIANTCWSSHRFGLVHRWLHQQVRLVDY